jgi:hypothetical protein
MNTNPTSLFLSGLIFVLVCSCSDWFRPTVKPLLSTDNLTIAVIPCEIIQQREATTANTKAQQAIIQQQLSQQLQADIYYRFINDLELHARPYLRIQHFSDTNNALAAQDISLLQAWQMSSPELAEVLGVDAVLRLTLESAIAYTPSWVDDTSHQQYAPDGSDYLNMGPPPNQIKAALYDGSSGMPLWQFKNRTVNDRGIAYKKIARKVTRQIGRALPKEA